MEKILARNIEINVVKHCNLSCRSCSHFSPIFKRSLLSPVEVLRDLTSLARFYRAQTAVVLGGEPLLHPEICDVLVSVRASGIADEIRVVTNGVRLAGMPDEFWRLVSEVRISLYPEIEIPDLGTLRRRANIHGTRLRMVHVQQFGVSYSEVGTSDLGLKERIYKSCKIAHLWRCHTVDGGYFFKCPQGLFVPMVLGRAADAYTDGIVISDDNSFEEELRSYLASDAPLRSCGYCLGSSGRLFDHAVVRREEWRSHQAKPAEELVDWHQLSPVPRGRRVDKS